MISTMNALVMGNLSVSFLKLPLCVRTFHESFRARSVLVIIVFLIISTMNDVMNNVFRMFY